MFGNLSLRGKKHDSGMSSFQALATAIAAQVGTGNIVGASGAILTGGPGAIFWMWIIAFFGMATIYAEATLAQETRIVEKDGNVKGGPVYYITTAFKGGFGKFLAGFFAVAITLALGFFGCMVQSNSIGSTMQTAFGIPSWIVGIVLVVDLRVHLPWRRTAPRLRHGEGRPHHGGYLPARRPDRPDRPHQVRPRHHRHDLQVCLPAPGHHRRRLRLRHQDRDHLRAPSAACSPTRPVWAPPRTPTPWPMLTDPHDQGVVAMIGVFIDTFVVLTLNALVIISTLYTADGPLASGYVGDITDVLGKANLAQTAFGVVFGESAGNMFVAVCLFFFAFSTILSWNLFGKINVAYLFGKKSTVVYTVLALVFIFLGTMMSNDLVWELSDMFNNLMVIPNAVALFALTSLVVKHADDPNRIPGKK